MAGSLKAYTFPPPPPAVLVTPNLHIIQDKRGIDAIGAQMGAHALFNAYKGAVGIMERNHLAEKCVMRLRIGALTRQVSTHKAKEENIMVRASLSSTSH